MRPVIASSESMAPRRLVMIQIRIPSPTSDEHRDDGQRGPRPARVAFGRRVGDGSRRCCDGSRHSTASADDCSRRLEGEGRRPSPPESTNLRQLRGLYAVC